MPLWIFVVKAKKIKLFFLFFHYYCGIMNTGIQIQNQQIPSGVFTALENANITGSLLHSYNDVNLRWISNDTWTYSLSFNGK